MKTGIIIHSNTGNTKSVAERIKEKLITGGDSAEIIRLRIAGEYKPGDLNVRLENMPDISPFDRLIIGSPVNAFSLAMPMKLFLKEIGDLSGRKIDCYVTMFFPFKWMGGYNAISLMKKICQNNNGMVTSSTIINWSSKNRENMIKEFISKIVN